MHSHTDTHRYNPILQNLSRKDLRQYDGKPFLYSKGHPKYINNMSLGLFNFYDLDKKHLGSKGLEHSISLNILFFLTFSSFSNRTFDNALIQSILKTKGSK